MTRFARSKGSKASNERVPEEATSWRDMKRQLEEKKLEVEENKRRKEADKMRSSNYQAFLDEKESNEVNNCSWADFPVDSEKNKRVKENRGELNGIKDSNKTIERKKVISKISETEPKNEIGEKQEGNELENLQKECVNGLNQTRKKRKRNAKKNKEEKKDEDNYKKKKPKGIMKPLKPVEEMSEKELKQMEKKKQRRMRQAEKRKQFQENKILTNEVNDKNKSEETPTKENKTKEVKIKKPIEEMTKEELNKYKKKKQKLIRQLEKRKQFKKTANLDVISNGDGNTETKKTRVVSNKQNNFNGPNKLNNKRKLLNENNNKEAKRRKPCPEVDEIHLHGEVVELVRFEGFPIKKEDFNRLLKLKTEMISKGIPRKEVQAALKLERRKAEKALTREKKSVCFNCRKSGHNLSECPNLNDETSGTGICFKCGSTEHTHLQCKLVRNQDFKFATCFICKEQGHISRQCPDNARGLYPKGGACKECGDVTHLKKDCPKYQAVQESSTVFVEKLSYDNNIEGLETDNKIQPVIKKKPNKIVKF